MDNLDRRIHEIIVAAQTGGPAPVDHPISHECPKCAEHPVVKQLRGLADWLGQSVLMGIVGKFDLPKMPETNLGPYKPGTGYFEQPRCMKCGWRHKEPCK